MATDCDDFEDLVGWTVTADSLADNDKDIIRLKK